MIAYAIAQLTHKKQKIMAGLLELFQDDQFGLGDSAHSRKLKGNKDLEVEFVAYNVVGAAQQLHSLITAPLPYQGGAAGPIVDTQ